MGRWAPRPNGCSTSSGDSRTTSSATRRGSCCRELADPTGAAEGEPPRLRRALAELAPFVGASAGDLVFVDNITAGANAVLRSLPLGPGDRIAVTSLGYGGVTNAAAYAARVAGAELVTIELPGPGAPAHEYVERIVAGLAGGTRVLVVDHITASTALILPLADIARAAHDRSVLVLADGAHVPGNIPLAIESLGVDFYAANLHKWAWAPRSSGLLWAAPEHHAVLHPPVISWGLDNGMAAEFDLLGTRDPSTHLSAPYAVELLRAEGLDHLYAYNHELAWWAGQHLTERWGTMFATPEAMIGAMVAVALPESLGASAADAETVRVALDAQQIEAPIYPGPDRLSTRVSAQIYCDRTDIERFADAVSALAGC